MKRQHDKPHLDGIRALPCIICGEDTTVEAAHIRFPDLLADKRPTGMGEKPDDCWALPLCGVHHRQQHEMSEREFWKTMRIDPIRAALALFRASGDNEAGQRIVAAHRQF